MAAETHGHTHRLTSTTRPCASGTPPCSSADPEQGIVLDRSAFYPGGGGQPPDEGVLLWGGVRTRIAGIRKGDELYLSRPRATRCHRRGPPSAARSTTSGAPR